MAPQILALDQNIPSEPGPPIGSQPVILNPDHPLDNVPPIRVYPILQTKMYLPIFT